MTVTRQQVIDAARAYLGVRWHHQGRTRAGLDCGGLLVSVAHDLGYPTAFDLFGYSRLPNFDSVRRTLEGFDSVAVDAVRPGDFVLMQFHRQPHIAIVTDHGIIHSYASVRRVVEHRIDEVWRARIVAAYAFQGIE